MAFKQRQAELRFERLDVPAYGAVGHAKLVGRSGEAGMAPGSLEGLQRIQRRQAAQHVSDFLTRASA